MSEEREKPSKSVQHGFMLKVETNIASYHVSYREGEIENLLRNVCCIPMHKYLTFLEGVEHCHSKQAENDTD